MPQKPSSLEKFWKELKRRKVISVITIYASASFGVIEIINNLITPLHLPGSVSTIAIIVLAVGFPFAFILSWIYDLTGGGFVRTKPIEDTDAEEKIKSPNAWKIATYISFAVIIVLVVLNITRGSNIIKPGMIQSLVVLPFDNETGDEKLDYFVSGMHSSLIGDIGRIASLRVISKTSSDVYKDVHKPLPQIASELDVDAVVEAQVMCIGDSICLQVRVVSADQKERQLWVGNYREDRRKILGLYNQVTKQIAGEVMVKLTPDEEQLLSKSMIVDREAYDDYLKTNQYLGDFSKESLQKAREYLNSAIEKDPGWAPLYSALAQVWLWIQQSGWESTSVTSPEIYKNLNKALELDPNLSEAHYLKAMIAHLMEWDWEKSEREFLSALANNPNDAQSRMLYAQLLVILQRTEEGMVQGRLALKLDPLNPEIKVLFGGLLNLAGDYKAALTIVEEITASDPGHFTANNMIFTAASGCKAYDKAIKADRYNLAVYNISEDDIKESERILKEQGIVRAYEKILELLEKFAEKNPVSFADMACRYIIANQPDKAMDWVEKGFELHDPIITYITTKGAGLEALHNNPRFIAIVKKMNLPLPNTN